MQGGSRSIIGGVKGVEGRDGGMNCACDGYGGICNIPSIRTGVVWCEDAIVKTLCGVVGLDEGPWRDISKPEMGRKVLIGS